MVRSTIYVFIMALALVLSACGSNDLEDGKKTQSSTHVNNPNGIGNSDVNNSVPMVLTITDPISRIMDINKSGVEKAIKVHLAQGSTAIGGKNIKISNPIDTIKGSFFVNVVKTDSTGNAVFAYTAPSSIIDSKFIVDFCLEENSSLCGKMSINLRKGTIAPQDNNDTNDTGNDFVNYGMTFKDKDNGNTLGLDERKLFIVSLIDKDTKQPIPAGQIKKITIKSSKPKVIKLIDPSDAVGAAVSELEVIGKSSANIYLKASKTISGLSDIKVTIEYQNQKGYDRVISRTYAITVLSGPPTALSITDAGTAYNKETKWFEQKFLISASDKYSNKINTSPTISVSVMAGFAKDSNGSRIIYGQNTPLVHANITSSGQEAILKSIGKAPFIEFDPVSLKGIDLTRDIVAIFGNVRTNEANGKWEIDSISSVDELALSDTYEGENYTAVGFAVGHNYRNDTCSDEYLEYQTKIDSTDGKYKLDDEGKTFVTLKYPAEYMPGKRVGLLVNLISENPETGKQLRGGEVKFPTLNQTSPFGLTGGTQTVAKATTSSFVLYGSVETGTDDKWALMSSKFSCSMMDSKNINLISIEQNDPMLCERPYVKYKVTTANNEEDGTLVLTDCVVDKEFKF